MKWPNKYDAKERRLIVAGAFTLALASALTIFGDRWIFQNANPNLDLVEFGKITERTNDARHRPGSELLWYPARVHQAIHLGDAVFAGPASTAHVNLNDGTSVDVNENSMVIFGRRHSNVLPNFASGHFKLHVDGHVTVAVAGRTTTLSARNTDVVLTVDDARAPSLRVIAGAVQIHAPGTREVRDLTPGTETTLALTDFETPAPSAAGDKVAETPVPQPEPLTATEITYVWRLEDLFSQNSDGTWARRDRPVRVGVDLPLRWANANSAVSVELEIAADAAFTNSERLRTREAALHLGYAYVGSTYWRVRGAHAEWSSPSQIHLTADFSKVSAPKDLAPNRLIIKDEPAELRLNVRAVSDVTRVVSELSRTRTFETDTTTVQVSSDPEILFRIEDEGDYFVRSQGVTAAGELTAWSEPYRVRVVRRPPEPPAVVQVETPAPEVIPEDVPARAPAADVETEPAPLVIDEGTSEAPNEAYRDDHLDIDAIVGQPQSSEQIAANRPAPNEFGLATENTKWFGAHGVVLGASGLRFGPSLAAGGSRTFEAHARYEHRWSLGVNVSGLHDIQLIALGGLTARGATSDHLYSPHHEVFQLGVGLDVPFAHRWSLDARMLLGAAGDETREYDGTVGVAYHPTRGYAVTLGYHVNLFETRSSSLAPVSPPFREGSTDVRLGVRFSY